MKVRLKNDVFFHRTLLLVLSKKAKQKNRSNERFFFNHKKAKIKLIF